MPDQENALTVMDTTPVEFEGDFTLRKPYGVVFLPSPYLDTMEESWIDWCRAHPKQCMSVNLGFLSKRMREAGAEPGHSAYIDGPRLRAKACRTQEEFLAPFIANNHTVCIWGVAPYWHYTNHFNQRKLFTAANETLPMWMGPGKTGPDEEDEHFFCGVYTSAAACNIMAFVLGWKCTIFVVGNVRKGGNCDLCVPMKEDWLEQERNRGPRNSATDKQWYVLRNQALEHGTEIVHVGPSPTKSVPVISETHALEVLHGTDRRADS